MVMVKKIISHPIFVGIVSALIARFLPDTIAKNGEVIMEFLHNYLWTGVWPIWVGLGVALIYWFIKFLFNLRRKYINYKVFVRKTEDDWKNTQKSLLDAWQKISYFENQIEQFSEVTIPSLAEKVNHLKNTSSLLLKSGVYWDEQFNPYCDKCRAPLSEATHSNILRCPKCNNEFILRHG